MVVVKVVEYVASSPESWEAAVKEGVEKIIKEFPNVRGIDVLGFKAVVREGKITEYRVNFKIAYVE